MTAGQEMLRTALQSLGTAVAIADPESWEIRFENACFFQWFPPGDDDPDAPLPRRLSALDTEKAATRLAAGRVFSLDTDVKAGARTLSLALELRRIETEEGPAVLVEARNVSKQREAEYMLDSYSRMAEKNARELQREKERVEKLLLNIMPRSVYDELKDFGTTTPQRFDAASVLMLDFIGFTDMAIASDPGSVVSELNDIFSAFDRITELFGCERIKTIGDAYVAVSGVPEAVPDHAANIARVALRMRRYLEKRNESHPTKWHCRIGVSTGALIGSMVGIQKYVYDIFGPAANLAARLEALCEPMQILIDEPTFALIGQEFATADLGGIEVKGFGTQRVRALQYETRARF